MRGLAAEGCLSRATNIVGTRGDEADTVSGPGWSNLLTGVWADKHGVTDNKFSVRHYDRYPHFFHHVKQAFPGAKTCSYVTWPEIHLHILSAAEEAFVFLDDERSAHYRQADEKCTAKAVRVLTQDDPDVMFVYLGAVDETGHQHGFHPSVPEYLAALEAADAQVGRVLAALHERPGYDQEHWLVLVGTDHGGQGKNHGGGRTVPEINTVWLIVSGPDAARGPLEGATHQVDLVATALAHLGVPVKPEWQLDGKPIGLKPPAR